MPDPLPRILIQLDPDPQPSAFDSIVALDAGVDQLLPYHGVQPGAVRDLVHGAIFTRSTKQLHRTAIFVGGSNVTQGERLFGEVKSAFWGPMRVSVMLDSSGANTTSVAAVLTAAQHLNLSDTTAAVFAATGPVGQRVARLLCRAGAQVRVGSRSMDRAVQVCTSIESQLSDAAETASAVPMQIANEQDASKALEGANLAICAGAAGVTLVTQSAWSSADELQVLMDLNAVPPAGADGVEATDKGEQREGKLTYGAIGVGGLKMRIHRLAIQKLFTSNDLLLDAEQIMGLAEHEGAAEL